MEGIWMYWFMLILCITLNYKQLKYLNNFVYILFFSCGEMENGLTGTKNASPCKNGQKILYAWAKNAPRLDLPEGVGFKVGGKDSDVNYLVLQVHPYNKLKRSLCVCVCNGGSL